MLGMYPQCIFIMDEWLIMFWRELKRRSLCGDESQTSESDSLVWSQQKEIIIIIINFKVELWWQKQNVTKINNDGKIQPLSLIMVERISSPLTWITWNQKDSSVETSTESKLIINGDTAMDVNHF